MFTFQGLAFEAVYFLVSWTKAQTDIHGATSYDVTLSPALAGINASTLTNNATRRVHS